MVGTAAPKRGGPRRRGDGDDRTVGIRRGMAVNRPGVRGTAGDDAAHARRMVLMMWSSVRRNFGILLQEGVDLVDGVKHGGVVLAAEAPPDVRVGVAGQLAGEVHGHLARERHGLGARLGAEVLDLDVEDLGDAAEDVVDRDEVLLGAPDVGEDLLGEVERERAPGQVAEGADAHEGALELPDVRLHAVADEVGDVVREGDAIELGLLLQDRDARLELRRLDVGDEARTRTGSGDAPRCPGSPWASGRWTGRSGGWG